MGGYQMHVGPSLLSADQKYPDPLQHQQQQYSGVGGSGGYASLPPNANLSLVAGIPMDSPVSSNPYYTSLLMLRPPSGSPHTDPSARKAPFFNFSTFLSNFTFKSRCDRPDRSFKRISLSSV